MISSKVNGRQIRTNSKEKIGISWGLLQSLCKQISFPQKCTGSFIEIITEDDDVESLYHTTEWKARIAKNYSITPHNQEFSIDYIDFYDAGPLRDAWSLSFLSAIFSFLLPLPTNHIPMYFWCKTVLVFLSSTACPRADT